MESNRTKSVFLTKLKKKDLEEERSIEEPEYELFDLVGNNQPSTIKSPENSVEISVSQLSLKMLNEIGETKVIFNIQCRIRREKKA